MRPDRAFTLVYAAGLPAELNNPNLRGNGWNEATSLVYSRLYHVGLDGKLQPDLVARDEISDDGLTWTLFLRRGVTWHDGRFLTAEDVRATLDDVFDPSAPCDLDLNLPMVKGIEYPGEGRVVIRLHYPAPLLAVPLAEIAILPAAPGGAGEGEVDEGAEVGVEPLPAGTGPYRYAGTREDGSLEFLAHGAFHLGKPSIPRIILREIAGDEARAGAVANGEVDLAHVQPQHTERIRRRSNIRVLRMATGAWRGMPLNLKRPNLQDRRVRQAIDLALDRKQIVVNALPRAGRAAYQPVPPASWAFSEELDRPYTNPQKARELLEEAGWYAGPDGLRRRGYRPKVEIASMGAPAAEEEEEPPLTFRLIVWKDKAFSMEAARMIRKQLRRVGIRVDLELVSRAAHNRLSGKMGEAFDGFIGGWGSLLDPGDNLYKKFHSRGSQNYMTYRNETIDRMLDQCRTATDPEAARGLYRRLMEHLRLEAVLLPLAYPDSLFAARERVAGIEESVVDSWYEFTRHAWRWRLEED